MMKNTYTGSVLWLCLLLSAVLSAEISDLKCPHFYDLENGKFKKYLRDVDHVMEFGCNDGYRLNGMAKSTCMRSSDNVLYWTHPLPKCVQVVPCPLPPQPKNGVCQETGLTVGSNVNCSCNAGHFMMGHSLGTCLKNGMWSNSGITCHSVSCQSLPQLKNGVCQWNTSTVGSEVDCACNAGHVMVGNSLGTCLDNGMWSNNGVRCDPVSCQTLPQLKNGLCQGTALTFGSKVDCACNAGHVMVGKSLRTCLDNGMWSNSDITCDPVTCKVPQLKNGVCQATGTAVGSKVNCHCNDGHRMVGSSSGTCLDTGAWSNIDVVCFPDHLSSLKCPTPFPPVVNGYVNYTSVNVGNTASFQCDHGYVINGRTTLTCTVQNLAAVWSDNPPTCNLKYCPMLSVPPNGNLSTFERHYGVSVTYICHSGFAMRHGNENRMCQSSGQWSGTAPYCYHECVHQSSCRVTEDCVVDSNGQGGCECISIAQCPSDFNPVCGTNGKQANNKCLLKVQSCHDNKHDVDVAANGNCEFGGVCGAGMPSPPAGNTCRVMAYRYWFNSTSQQCERYAHGSCFEGHNTFFTQSDCEQKCIQTDVCKLPFDVGRCNYLNEKRYFFNTTTQQCKSFTYGGCFGNENHFYTEQQCKNKCTCVSPLSLVNAQSSRDAVILLRISSVRKVKNSEVSYTVKVTAVCSSGQGVSIRLDATKTSLQVVESTQGHLQCPQFVKGKTYGVAVNQVSSSADLQELKVTKSFYVEETMTCPS